MNSKVVTISCLLSFWLFQAGSAFSQDYSNDQSKLQCYTESNPYQTVTVQPVKSQHAKNVILLIGDGMGLNQVSAAWIANQGKLNIDNFKHIGLMRTYAANKLITDSGAAGTAMATGKKTNYHSVGVDSQGNELPSLTDVANELGLSTAVVVTCGVTDATPAAFCANNADRDMEEDLAADFLSSDVDFIFGGGRKQFINRYDKRNLLNEMAANGYHTPFNWEELDSISSGKVIALLDDGQLALFPERGQLYQNAVMKSLSLIDQNNSGFFAMFEGSRIDDCGHWHDIPKLVQEVFDFDQTIGKVLQWAENDGETLVIVLADHETGGLTILDGKIEDGTVCGDFSTGGHSGILVPVYAYGPQAEEFTGIFENSAIFSKISSILKNSVK